MFRFLKIGSPALPLVQLLMITGAVQMQSDAQVRAESGFSTEAKREE